MRCKSEEELFEKELMICKNLARQNQGKCAWGECHRCGVIFLLYKIFKNKLVENPRDIAAIRKLVLGINKDEI
jgi:hypothetical protein